MAHAYSFLGSWVRSEPVTAEGHVGCPQLLVVGAENSLDPGPIRLGQEVKWGALRRRRHDRWRNRDATAVKGVFLNTALPRGHHIPGM